MIHLLSQDNGLMLFYSSSCFHFTAITTGAVPPLNAGLSVTSRLAFQAGGATWIYTRTFTNEILECAGPLKTSVRVEVKDAA